MSKEEGMDDKSKLKEEYIELHRAFTRYLIALLRSDAPIKANQLDTARRFLKDNNITLDKLEGDNGEEQSGATDYLDLPFKGYGEESIR